MKNSIKSFTRLIALITIICAVNISYGQTTTAIVNFSTSGLAAGSIINVPVVFNSTANVGAWQVLMYYNRDVLAFQSVTANPIWVGGFGVVSNSDYVIPAGSPQYPGQKCFKIGFSPGPGVNFACNNLTAFTISFRYNGGNTNLEVLNQNLTAGGTSLYSSYIKNPTVINTGTVWTNGYANGPKVPITSVAAGGIWNSAASWNPPNVPNVNANTEIFIGSTTNPLEINDNLSLPLNLTVNSGAKLTLDGTKIMNVNAKVFTIKSGGSFVNSGTCSGNAIVEFFLPGTGNRDTIWHLYSSPVNNSPVEVFNHFFVYYWDAANEQYIDLYNGDYLANQRGYVCFNTANISSHPDITLSFSGTLNNGDQALVSLAWPHNPGNTEQNWNLIGNPFTSAVDIDLLTYSGVDPTIYYYIGNGGNYATYNKSTFATTNGGQDKVPAMQGFWVRTNAASPSVTFTNASRVHSSQAFYKEQITKTNYLSLFADANGFTDETVIAFYNGATGNFESDFDAVKMAGFYNDVPSFYSKGTDNSNLAVNGISEPELNQTINIPMSFVLGINANSTIRAEGINTFGNDISLRLEDLVAQQIIDLRANSSYSFNYLQGGNQNRFVLHISKSANGIEENASTIDTYFWNNSLYINNAPNAEVVICNLLGQELLKRHTSNTTTEKINLSGYTTGYYIVKIFNGNQISTKKVYIQ